MSSRSRSRSKYVDDYDDDFNEDDDDYDHSTTRQTTTHKSTIASRHIPDQSSYRTLDNSNFNNSYENDTANFSKKDGLSSKELKTKLIESFKNKGILNSMKSQLRNKLVLELNSNFDQNKNKAFLNTNNQKSNLALNTINCLLINHLKSSEYDYTLSVFMPECGIGLNEVYSLSDILHILKVSPESKLYSEISTSPVVKSKGLLWFLVSYFCSHYVTHEIGTQTEFDSSLNKASLEFKLQKLDNLYSSKTDSLNSKLKLDDKMILYQNNLEEKVRQEYQDKINQFKEIEIARIRQEEKEKLRAELQDYRQELDQAYQKRSEAMNQREESLNDLLKQRKDFEEREIFVQRQHLLDEMKQLKEREADFKKSTEMQAKFYHTDASKYEKLDDELKKRELKLQQEQEQFDLRLRDERERIKLDLERAFAQREFVLQSVETKNKQDTTHNEIERAHLERIKREYQNQQIKSNEMELELQKCFGQLECYRQENELMKHKLTHCMDYDFIKQENNMLKYKLDVSKELIGKKTMNSNRRSTSEKQYVPQRKRSVTFAENGPFNNNNNNSIPPLQLNNDNSMMLATEQGADQLPRDTIRSNIADLTEYDEVALETFRDAGDRVLSDEIEKSEIKDNLEQHNLINSELRNLYEMQVYEQRKLQETVNDVKKHVEFLYHGVSDIPVNETKPEPILNTSLEFIDSAKERLKYLENEGERIDQNYRDYQHKLKSKYYPIADDDSNQMRIKDKMTEYNKQIDVDKFLESTLKANLNAKMMREELEAEFYKVNNEKKQRSTAFSINEIRNVEELIKSVAMVKDNSIDTIRQQIFSDQNDLKRFQTNKESNYSLKQDYLDNSSLHSASFTPRVKSPIKNNVTTMDEEEESIISKKKADLSSPKAKANFGLGEYVKMFDEKKEEISVAKIEQPVRKSVQIEYSSTSSSATTSTSSNSDDDSIRSHVKVKESYKKEVPKNDDDDDDDFKW